MNNNKKTIVGIIVLTMMILVSFSPLSARAQSASDIQAQITAINSQIASSTAMIDSLKTSIDALKKQLISLNNLLKNSPPTFAISDVPTLSSIAISNGNGNVQSTLVTATFNLKITGTSNDKTALGLPASNSPLVPANTSVLSIYKNGIVDSLSNYNPVVSYSIPNGAKMLADGRSFYVTKGQTVTLPVVVKFVVNKTPTNVYAVKLSNVSVANNIVPITGNLFAGIPSTTPVSAAPTVSSLLFPTVGIISVQGSMASAVFSMSYTLTAGNSPVFISSSSTIALTSSVTGAVGNMSVVSFRDNDATADAPQYFFIAPGQTKTFTVNYQSKGMPGTVAGTYRITGLNWGIGWSGTSVTPGGTLNDPAIGNTLFVNLSY